jgi:hypothetical protein
VPFTVRPRAMLAPHRTHCTGMARIVGQVQAPDSGLSAKIPSPSRAIWANHRAAQPAGRRVGCAGAAADAAWGAPQRVHDGEKEMGGLRGLN